MERNPGRDGGARRGRLAAALSGVIVAVSALCLTLGYMLAWEADAQREGARRQALGATVSRWRIDGADLDQLTPQQIDDIGRASGIAGLRAEPEAGPVGKDAASVLDDNGRLVGWFRWSEERPVTALMDRLAPLLALMALCGLGLGVVSLVQARRGSGDGAAEREPLEADRLTGLPNQYRMRDITTAMLEARAPDEIVVYGYADIDRFEDTTHGLSRGEGDTLLAEFAARLSEALAPGVVGRLGGDCFAFVATMPDIQSARHVAEAAARAVARPYRIAPGIQLTAGFGLSVAPHDGLVRDDLVRRTQLALHAAKQSGRGAVVLFTADMEADVEERRFIKSELATALTDHSLAVHYQPIVTSDGATILGVEALLRWNHPERGDIPPARFVPVAEETGLMDRLGQFVLRRALADAAHWPELFVSVNLSPLQVRDPAFVGIVSSLLAEAQFEPSRLILEVTEGVLIDDPAETEARLQELRGLGVRLALDDFGSGYSSLSYLQRLPFDKLKIDRGFVSGLASSTNGGVIVQAIVALGRALGMSVLVEGVETEEQRIVLRLAGCDEMQGFLFSKAVPRERVDALRASGHETGRLRSLA